MHDTKASQCLVKLTGDILSGKMLPGQKLLSESLKKRYQVGMSPVREALSKITATGLVTFEDRKGFSVSRPKPKELQDDLYTFCEIECLCLQQAIICGDDRWEGEILSTLHCLKSKTTFRQWLQSSVRFQNALIAACPLKSLRKIRDQLYMRHRWYTMLSHRDVEIPFDHVLHLQIAEAAIARDATLAIQLLREHILSAMPDLMRIAEKPVD